MNVKPWSRRPFRIPRTCRLVCCAAAELDPTGMSGIRAASFCRSCSSWLGSVIRPAARHAAAQRPAIQRTIVTRQMATMKCMITCLQHLRTRALCSAPAGQDARATAPALCHQILIYLPTAQIESRLHTPASRLPRSPGSVTPGSPGSGVAALVRASTASTPRRNAASSPSSPGSNTMTRLPQLPPAACHRSRQCPWAFFKSAA